MSRSSRTPTYRQPSGGWRDYQASLQRSQPRRSRRSQRPRPRRRLALGLLTLLALFGLANVLWPGAERPAKPVAAPAQPATAPKPAAVALAVAPQAQPAPPAPALPAAENQLTELPADIHRQQLRQLLNPRAFGQLSGRELTLTAAGQPLRVETTLDAGLQSFLLGELDRKNSRYVGIVVIEPGSGKVLALAGFDRNDPDNNPCLASQFPAASIFKIITAATAVDQLGYTVDTPVSFGGAKHTLYKQQLVDKKHRSDATIPLGEAFAESINPVFGKLGSLRLGKAELEQAAANFGFNQPLDFELPLPPSQFQISDEPYNWAEIASGFNLETTLSPLHGALLAATMVNGGRMPTPSIIESLADGQGKPLYHRQSLAAPRALISPRAADEMVQMMETTVSSGTAHKAFRNYQKDRDLAGLQIGGKTGSLDNATHDVRYDWFVGFAREPQGKRQLAVGVMVAHQEFIGTRAGDYARRAFGYYFGHPDSGRR